MRAGVVWLPKAVWNSPRRLPSTRRQTTDTPCKRRISLPRVVRGGGGEEEEEEEEEEEDLFVFNDSIQI